MFRRSLLVAALVAPGLFAQAPTLETVLAKHYEALGGLAKLQAVQTMRITGKMAMGPAQIPMVLELKRPASLRMDIDFQGNKLIQAYDGKTGWSINPFASAKKTAEPMTPDELKEMAVQADFDGVLVDWKAKGHTVELQGKESADGSDAYKLKVTLKNGDTIYIFLDTDSYLSVKEAAKHTIRGAEMETETLLGDYKEVAGIMRPYSMEAGAKGSPQRQKITLDKIEVNVPVDDARFKMPEAPAPAPAEKK